MTREEAIKEIKMWGIEAPRQREVLETLIPELRESEEEQAIRIIKKRMCYDPVPISDEDRRIVENWLEKQKDAFENGRQLGIMQEQARQELGWPDEKQKEHQNKSDALGKALGRDLISPKDKDKNLDEIAQDYVDNVKEYNPEPTWDLLQTAVCYGYHYCEQVLSWPEKQKEEEGYEAIPVKSTLEYKLGFADGRDSERQKEQKSDDDPLDDPKFLKGFDTGREVQRIFDEQKPAEWSEEDERNYEYLHQVICCYINNPQIEYKEREKASKKLIPFLERLKSLPERFNLQPKQEWSEEDEMMVKSIVNVLKRFEHQGATDMKIDWLQNKLKSLRPSWKPSEEQMEALKDAVRLFKETHFEKFHYKIESLYEQLKSIQ